MDFLNWWFETHYILSTILTMAPAFLWCIFKGEVLRGWVIVGIWLLFGGMKITNELCKD